MDKREESLTNLLENLASSVVVLDVTSAEELNVLKARLEDIRRASQKNGLTAVKKATEFLNNFLSLVKTAGKTEKFRQALSCWVSMVRQAAENPPADEDTLTADIKKQFKEIFESPKSPPEDEFSPKIPRIDLSEGTGIFLEFIDESLEHLQNAEQSLLSLESLPDNAEEINKAFREFHTIKGVSSFLNLDDIRILSHDTETMMDLVRRGALKLERKISEAAFLSIDLLRKLLALLKEQVSNNGVLKSPYIDISQAVNAIRAIVRQQAADEPKDKKLGEILTEKEIVSDPELFLALEEQKTEPDKRIGQILVDIGAATPSQVERGLEEQKKTTAGIGEGSIRIALRKLDDLMDMIGELVITATQVMRNPEISTLLEDSRLQKDVGQLDRIIRDIQNISMSIRLTPIRPLFQKMLRITRDLAVKAGKKIKVNLSGEDTEIDKNIIDLIHDPLVHMVRNSIDHGIEAKEVRLSRGKREYGTIDLIAYHKSGNIVIEVKDDGGGLDAVKIRQRAITQGLMQEGEELSEKELFRFIFQPGFSTAERVTEVSGRGVGMDVVKRNIEKLMGAIEVESQAGKETRFIIRLPLTLAIIDGIVVTVGEERYIIPNFAIAEFVKIRKEDVTVVAGKGELVMIHGNLFPVLRLDKYFKIRYKAADIEGFIGCLVNSDYGQVCILLDELIGQQQIVIKSLGGYLKHARGLAGATILGDGKVGLILDVNGIAAIAKGANVYAR